MVINKEFALGYEDKDVVDTFQFATGLSDVESNELFEETKKWLFLNALHQELASKGYQNIPSRLTINEDLLIVDEMWHTFILFTKRYANYCQKAFGAFVHHQPTPVSTKLKLQEAFKQDRKSAMDSAREQLETQLHFIYDQLGASTVVKWYEEIPKRFPPKRVSELKNGR